MKKAMRTNKKSLCQILVVLALIVSMVLPAVVVNRADASTTFKSGDAYYKILSSSGKTVEYVRPAKKTYTVICIPITVKIKGKDYRVVSVSANACKGCTKLKWITVGMSVEKIGKNAFAGCKKLKGVDIDSERLTAKSVGANAFKGINEKALVTVPNQKLAAYKKFLKARGITGKKQKIKGVKWISDFDPKVSQFEVDDWMDDMGGIKSTHFEFADANAKKTSQYFAGDTVPLESEFCLLPPIYGHWERDERELIGNVSYCNTCHRYFQSYAYGMHTQDGMWFDHSKICGGSCYITGVTGKGLHSWVFVPDPDPCKVVASFTLPEGLTCSKGDVKVVNRVKNTDLTGACKINVSGDRVTVTIDNVKEEPFYLRSNYEAYIKDATYHSKIKNKLLESFRNSVTIRINAKVDSGVGKDNIIKNSVSYEYKGASYTCDLPDISFHTASLKIAGCTDASGNSLDGAEYDLYRTTTNWKQTESGGVIGAGDWSLFASGLHVGDVVTGLGSGEQADIDGQYRLEQTKTPAGYLQAQSFYFTLKIDTDGKIKITAVDDDDNELPVENGTVMVTFVNYNKSKYSNSAANNPEDDDDDASAGNGSTNTGGSSSSGTVGKKAVAKYYKNGQYEFCGIYETDEFDSNGMLDTGLVSYYEAAFTDCRLEKITVNGETVDSLPAKIPYGTEIGFWYVTD